jgi:hypothetical protein
MKDKHGFPELASLYSTLVSWGLHRMVPSYMKLTELDKIKDGFRRQKNIIDLQVLEIDDLNGKDCFHSIKYMEHLRISSSRNW